VPEIPSSAALQLTVIVYDEFETPANIAQGSAEALSRHAGQRSAQPLARATSSTNGIQGGFKINLFSSRN
jgi:hypothetical protein